MRGLRPACGVRRRGALGGASPPLIASAPSVSAAGGSARGQSRCREGPCRSRTRGSVRSWALPVREQKEQSEHVVAKLLLSTRGACISTACSAPRRPGPGGLRTIAHAISCFDATGKHQPPRKRQSSRPWRDDRNDRPPAVSTAPAQLRKGDRCDGRSPGDAWLPRGNACQLIRLCVRSWLISGQPSAG